MFRSLKSPLLAALAILPGLHAAAAHGGADPRVKISLTAHEIWFETSVGADHFMAFDANKDGHLSKAEYRKLFTAAQDWLNRQVRLVDPAGIAVAPYFSDAPIIEGALLSDDDAVEHIKIIRRYRLPETVHSAQLNLDLFSGEEHEPVLLMSRAGTIKTALDFAVCLPATANPLVQQRSCLVSTKRTVKG